MNELGPRHVAAARDSAVGDRLLEARIAGVDDLHGAAEGWFGLHVPPPVDLTLGFILQVRSR